MDEDVFFLLGIEIVSVDIAQYRELLIESVVVVFLQIRREDGTSFFYEKVSLLAVDELPDVLSCLRRLDKREPDRLRLLVDIRDDLDALTVMELIVERDNLTVDLGHRELVAET